MLLVKTKLFCSNVRLFFTKPLVKTSDFSKTFKFNELQIDKGAISRPLPDLNSLKFGETFSDHMLTASWNSTDGWQKPMITPTRELNISPTANVLHNASEIFEGMKAYRGVDNNIRLFRPELNMSRMKTSSERLSLPDFDSEEMIKCISELIRVDQRWIPPSTTNGSLYIRPTLIGTDDVLDASHPRKALLFVIAGPVGPYYPTGVKPIGLLADSQYVRSWPGGVGYTKAGCNYGPTMLIGKEAEKLGLQNALWLFGSKEIITEAGSMNLFVYWINENGEKELVTPPTTDGLILPGVTRQSILELSHEWNEFGQAEKYLTMRDIRKAIEENRLLEMFGSGTAAVISPIDRIIYKKNRHSETLKIPTNERSSLAQRLLKSLTDIQYGRTSKPEWIRIVEKP